ncbi:MAG: ATP-binding protein [Methanobrevibacter woesei]|uniref:ATP-binding protein n=1 Tax=Methanobrevibacter woesei TaxID=190976 RepID=UPI0023F18BFC|nr:ATP-binding protein [Methanobrevibacter woesei]MCI7291004.1 ATP-binding protein [Methanobrevibacter woesei]
MINNELVVEPTNENLEKIFSFVGDTLKEFDISSKYKFQLELAIEEIFVNIVSYSNAKSIKVTSNVSEDPLMITIRFIDDGVQFNPLEKEDADVHLDLDEKPIGGLGLILVKNNVNEISYEYIDNKNALTIKKTL